jgi:hypothetical protein
MFERRTKMKQTCDLDSRDKRSSFSRLRCPRCLTADALPWTLGTRGVWLQCHKCHKLWEQEIGSVSATRSSGVAAPSRTTSDG